jgi:phosphatidylethanolamine/phosphatidyl-N-methylethanolamine N-methyltransferase
MIDRIAKVYDHMAPVYYFVFGFSLEGARRRALKFANIKPNEKILEVGVGTGLTFRHLPDGIDFTGVDLSEKMLDQSRRRAKEQGRDFRLLHMNASKLEFENESFDLVIAAHFLSATSNPIPALSEMKRVLKKDGRILIVNNFQKDGRIKSILEPIAKKMGFSVQLNLSELCAQMDLKIQKLQSASTVLPVECALLVKS